MTQFHNLRKNVTYFFPEDWWIINRDKLKISKQFVFLELRKRLSENLIEKKNKIYCDWTNTNECWCESDLCNNVDMVINGSQVKVLNISAQECVLPMTERDGIPFILCVGLNDDMRWK